MTEKLFARPALLDRHQTLEAELRQNVHIALVKLLNSSLLHSRQQNSQERWYSEHETEVEMLLDSDAEIQALAREGNYQGAAELIVQKIQVQGEERETRNTKRPPKHK
ncbi:hypothetical protein A2477_00130 [Candidatus Falkowbacteria bacterium RIFOXYC2_FULL_47_12]|uniref:Uncharacterized protein n=2 Tax=Candidatus Falkowiibacteriota TaxID=1752728 RepID=A0A1F5TR92_9BACT|nr:MAG: hypothetical protein A2242_00505 [Candidatus Falkowbacteria bacterium RIFOXYA2_FULL_47_9]OGF41455.1 MAG: hypothetical protein A2477_00130 [Candidatus Falkowbacteria bacterium RIFOXYC2_FULL_47_12]